MTGPIRLIRIEGDVAYVPLTQGYEAIIDAADVPLVEGWNWSVQINKRKDGTIGQIYSKRNYWVGCNCKRVAMHNVLMPAPIGYCVDHMDGNGLNNRRSNLRIATHSENMKNRKLQINNTSGVKGVTWHKSRQKWQASIRSDGVVKYLAWTDCLQEAERAYEIASQSLHGEFGRVA